MKKAIIIITSIAIVLTVPLFCLKCYNRFRYLDEDRLSEVLARDHAQLMNGTLSDDYREHFKTNFDTEIEPVLKRFYPVMQQTEFVPLEKARAVRVLSCRNIDKTARRIYLPWDRDAAYAIGNMQFFEAKGQQYLLCYYSHSRFMLYTYDKNDQLAALLAEDCFSGEKYEKLLAPFRQSVFDGGLFSTTVIKPRFREILPLVLLRYTLPVCVSAALFFIPFLKKNKKQKGINKKDFIYRAAGVGLFAVPAAALACIVWVM